MIPANAIDKPGETVEIRYGEVRIHMPDGTEMMGGVESDGSRFLQT